MPRGYWGTFFAVGLVAGLGLALLFLAWAVPEFRDPAYAFERQPDPGSVEQPQQDDVSRIVAAIREFDPWSDTYAQWLMAVFSVIATGISIAAVVIVRDTLKETRRAVKAADDAVAVTRDLGEAQIRAYLGISTVEARYGGNHKPVIVSFSLHAKNSGQTPAKDVSVLAFVAQNLRRGQRQGTIIRESHIVDILPNAEPVRIVNVDYPVSEHERDLLLTSSMPLFVMKGRVWYRPVVGSTRRYLRFHYLIHPPIGGTNQSAHLEVVRADPGNSSN